MLYRICLTLFCISKTSLAFCSTDTLLYRSAYEERIILQAVNNQKPDLLVLFSAINTDSAIALEYTDRLNKFYDKLDAKLTSITSNKQRCKVIFKEVHEHFFIQYVDHISFNKIFKSGQYNCVTGSMLYSLVLKRYGVPYAIKEKPTHVYLVAYPGSDDILFETTNPKGFYVPDEKQKKMYLERLVALKFTTDEHIKSVGVSSAFDEFYYNSENISDKELASLQYMNFALSEAEAKNYELAIRNVMKAKLLYPSPKHRYLAVELLSSVLHNSKYDQLLDVRYLCEYANLSQDQAERNRAKSIFADIIQKQLIDNDNEPFTVSAYAICKSEIRDSSLVKDITFTFHDGMSYRYAVKSEFENSLEHSREAFKINPNNVTLQERILRAIVLMVDEIPEDKRVSTVEGFPVTFPFLKQNNNFKALLLYTYAMNSYKLFSKNIEAEGYAYLKKAEEVMKGGWKKVANVDQFVGLMYAEAGAYHFRKHQYEKAKAILLTGLEVVPDHHEIRARLEIVEDEKMRAP